MKGFLGIDRIKLPMHCVIEAYKQMRNAGQKGLEGVALFAGKDDLGVFTVKETIVPKQVALSLKNGLLYSVGEEELYRINVWLYKHDMSLIAQIHSHPGRAYHSETDDAFPIMATVGGISIVVPNYASGPMDPKAWAVYRLSIDGIWEEQDEVEIGNLIEVIY